MDAARCQYLGERCGEDITTPFTGLDVWLILVFAAVIIVIAVLIRSWL